MLKRGEKIFGHLTYFSEARRIFNFFFEQKIYVEKYQG